MKNSDKIKRAIAFYFSVALYFILLPIILSYSLGYKINYRKFMIYKTGIIYINSAPAGAEIYVNGKKDDELTPTQIEELRPGIYKIEVKRDGFYSWEKEIVVRPNMVTKADKIILFPIIQQSKMIAAKDILDFAVSTNNFIYYMTKEGLFRSNMDGTGFAKISFYSNWPSDILAKKFFRENNKFLYFNKRSVWAVYLNLDKATAQGNGEYAEVEEITSSDDRILDVFWYSAGNYIIVVTEKYITVVELSRGGKRNPVLLYKFSARPERLYYDSGSDSLYFTDTGKDFRSKEVACLYRIDLRQTFFDKLIKMLLKREVETHDEKK